MREEDGLEEYNEERRAQDHHEEEREAYHEAFPGDQHGIHLNPPIAPTQPAWPLVDQAHPPPWTGADEGEAAGLLGEPGAGEAAEQGQAGPARTHEWRFKGGNATITVETGGDFDDPDCWIEGLGDHHAGLKSEILRLAGRVQAAEAFAAEALEDRDRIHRALRDASVALAIAEGRADVAEERASDRDAAVMTAEEGLEINAELTAALAVLLAEPPPEPCSPGCRTPHLSAKASKAVDEALGRWQATERQLLDVQGTVAELEAELDETQAQEASAGNWVVRQMRELREALKARGLWRSAGKGEPGGGTAGSAIEAIDRLVAERDKLKAWAEEATGKAAKALDELAVARVSAAHNAEGWEAEKRVLAEVREEGRREGLRQAADLLDEAGCAVTSLRCGYPKEVAEDLTQRIQAALDLVNAGQPDGQ